jgi:hypothetical protein
MGFSIGSRNHYGRGRRAGNYGDWQPSGPSRFFGKPAGNLLADLWGGKRGGEADCNIVISSAAVPDYLYTRASFEQMIHRRQVARNPLSLTGVILISIFVIIAIFAPLIAPAPAGHLNPYMIPHDGYSMTPQPPSENHRFGTTQGQYDIFYGVIWGTRTAFRVALVVMGITLLAGIFAASP